MSALLRRMQLGSVLALGSFALGACAGEPLTEALTEPIRVRGAQFHEGTLPGAAPLSDDDLAAGAAPREPHVTTFDYPTDTVNQGYSQFALGGRATASAASIALRFADTGSGYWSFPVSAPDPFSNGQYTWATALDFAPHLARGRRRLLIAALDDSGHAGTQEEIVFCVTSRVPDNLNACNPKIAPPAAVLSLSWDTEVDLDLQLITPNGKLVDARHPSTALPGEGGKVDMSAPGTGILDRDSNRNCTSDGIRTENVVWKDKPLPGRYLVYANLIDACGESHARFNVSFHVSAPGPEPETYAQSKVLEQGGQLHAIDANGGTKLGLFVTQFDVQ
ncbi:MAG TPA: hypothetical protein VK524_30425 [Polyangiaceae bacterium]|nr:hypothetical protein [Polyangiaceae bacterium]